MSAKRVVRKALAAYIYVYRVAGASSVVRGCKDARLPPRIRLVEAAVLRVPTEGADVGLICMPPLPAARAPY